MTRWGVLSDIHGNLPALTRAVARCRELGATRFAVLGDNLGRGDSDGCVQLIRASADVSVLGNRDLDWADRVGPASRDYVLSLPRIARTDSFIVSHGDARLERDLSTDAIRDGFTRAARRLASEHIRVWLFGHSHHARVWRLPAPVAPTDPPDLLFDATRDALPATIALASDDPQACWAINVGSVGLPFGGKGPASFVVYDDEARTAYFEPV